MVKTFRQTEVIANFQADGLKICDDFCLISVVDGLIGRSPEIEADVRWPGRIPGALSHEDGDHVLCGVRTPGGSHAAVPAEATGNRRDIVAPSDYRHAESPAEAVKGARDQTRHRFLLWRQLVGCHGLD